MPIKGQDIQGSSAAHLGVRTKGKQPVSTPGWTHLCPQCAQMCLWDLTGNLHVGSVIGLFPKPETLSSLEIRRGH